MPKFVGPNLQTLPLGYRFWWIYGTITQVQPLTYKIFYNSRGHEERLRDNTPIGIVAHIQEDQLTAGEGVTNMYKQYIHFDLGAADHLNLSFLPNDRIVLIGHSAENNNQLDLPRQFVSVDTRKSYMNLWDIQAQRKIPRQLFAGYKRKFLMNMPDFVDVSSHYSDLADFFLDNAALRGPNYRWTPSAKFISE